jgi:uncharacterized protein YciI
VGPRPAIASSSLDAGRPPMFVLLPTYIKPLAEVDALMREHVAWLDKQYDAGRFVVS